MRASAQAINPKNTNVNKWAKRAIESLRWKQGPSPIDPHLAPQTWFFKRPDGTPLPYERLLIGDVEHFQPQISAILDSLRRNARLPPMTAELSSQHHDRMRLTNNERRNSSATSPAQFLARHAILNEQIRNYLAEDTACLFARPAVAGENEERPRLTRAF